MSHRPAFQYHPFSRKRLTETNTFNDYRLAVNKQEKQRSRKTRLFVETSPKDARVRILNIVPKFEQGIVLQPGRHHIEVSAKGFKTDKRWIVLEKGETRTLKISLKGGRAPKKKPSNGLFRIHKIKGGETLWSVSTKYGVSLFVLMQVNNLSEPNIYIGQELLIPLKPIMEEDVSKESREWARNLLTKGHAHRDLGEYTQAITYYLEALVNDPGYIRAHYSIGFAYLKLNRPNEAIASFKKAVDINPYNPETHYYLGLSYFIAGRKDPAFGSYDILKTLDPQLAQKLLSYIKDM
jgi:tetratricopeptide (TPR) repeat protein